ncbi:Planctomycete cytochrome C [Rubripirellula lacrimiformis]|uniref:Planctomycete cytochrome C n=1 Tax=Rubripirellula lacrimiformis TaxID=1930273 RepID=A0A517NIA6_9BACT|nr:DUF1592 domain-containing protein [Rubripirellula lacrimiformis]QDT06865.1 Planctomycete cytochrome C [Rubripirellula lacrimiformis]
MLGRQHSLSHLWLASAIAAALGLLSETASLADPAQTADQRVTDGLVVLYDFQDTGDVVYDNSDVGDPIDMRISNVNAVRRLPGSLEVTAETTIASDRNTRKLSAAVKQSGELTIETWIRPAKIQQSGPARIVTFSQNSVQRNFTLGQDNAAFDVRLRSASRDANGLPSTVTQPTDSQLEITHVVFTRDRDGHATIYQDGNPITHQDVKGDFDSWSDSFNLGIGNEISGGRPWIGTYHLVAIYNRSLSADQVQQNFRVGPGKSAAAGPGSADTVAASGSAPATNPHHPNTFQTEIAPLLSKHCLECHDSASKQGGLDLSRRAGAFVGGDSGGPIVPRDAGHSLLYTAVESDEMPLDREPLTDEQKSVLRRWINEGAQWTIDYVDPAIYRHTRPQQNWVQRLTVTEYISTVKATVGVDVALQAREILPADGRADGFRNTAYNLNVDFAHVNAYAQMAEIIVDEMDVVEFAKPYAKNETLTDPDMRSLIESMGRWVLRGPLTNDEVILYRGVSTSVASAGGTYRDAVKYVLQTMLQSPRFLYRIEPQSEMSDGSATSNSAGAIDGYAMAARISYILWGSSPDKRLIRAAERGQLDKPNLVRHQIQRMLEDELAVERSIDFVHQWLDLDRLHHLSPDPSHFPDWDENLANDMRVETTEFFRDLVWQQRQPLSKLLDAPFTYATPRLAKHYRWDAPDESIATADVSAERSADDDFPDGFRRYDLTSVPSRGGLLTQGSVLTIGGDNASMVTRGLFVLRDLLYSEVGDPPPGLDITPVPTRPGRTHRSVAAERIKSEACGGCHQRFEPLAFGLERYDGLGTYRVEDEFGNSLRQDGEILFPGEAESVAYQTASELMQQLASSDRVAQCLTRKVVQFSLGRPLVAADHNIVQKIHANAMKAGGTYQAIVEELLLSELVRN